MLRRKSCKRNRLCSTPGGIPCRDVGAHTVGARQRPNPLQSRSRASFAPSGYPQVVVGDSFNHGGRGEPSWDSSRCFASGVHGSDAGSSSAVIPLAFLGRDVSEGAVEALVVVPVHPADGEVQGVGDRPQGSGADGCFLRDGLVLVEAPHGLRGGGVVVGGETRDGAGFGNRG